ncbi:bola-like protein-domain-containing protein [Haematococcus lacustris]|nr:hypothetical protein QJQ45_015672 [Haematococcus lacustris]
MLRLGVRMASVEPVLGPIASAIKSKIEESLKPSALKLTNDSHKHAGHYEKDGTAACEAGETHFRLEVVAAAFQGMPLVQRHRLVNQLVAPEFAAGLHALSLTLKAPAEVGKQA